MRDEGSQLNIGQGTVLFAIPCNIPLNVVGLSGHSRFFAHAGLSTRFKRPSVPPGHTVHSQLRASIGRLCGEPVKFRATCNRLLQLDRLRALAGVNPHGYKPANSQETAKRGRLMAVERTFSIIKPDATRRNLTGKINAVIEGAGLRIVAQKRVRWTRAQAEKFYEEHKARPFYGELVDFMTSGPIVLQVLEGENAIAKYREVMGATDPKEAAEGTVRKLFAESKGSNSTHGSDSPAAADREIALNFRLDEIVG